MIESGGVYYNISGDTPKDIFADVAGQIALPPGVDSAMLYEGLCERESLMTTAIGNGIAFPHPRVPLVTSEKDERIYVCFLDRPTNFRAMDGKLVYVLFIILSCGSSSHLKALSRLSWLFQQESFRNALMKKPDTQELVSVIKQYS
jgi:PTS system nitrogen regulatory IIA component